MSPQVEGDDRGKEMPGVPPDATMVVMEKAPAITFSTKTLPLFISSHLGDDLLKTSWSFAKAAISYLIVMGLSITIAALVKPQGIGLMMLSLLPSLLFLTYMYRSFPQHTLKKQMVMTLFEAVRWMAIAG